MTAAQHDARRLFRVYFQIVGIVQPRSLLPFVQKFSRLRTSLGRRIIYKELS